MSNHIRYELEPDNRNCTDDVLLNDLKAVAKRLGKVSLTKDEYNKEGRFSASTMQKRFGSWNIALSRSGLVVQKRMDIPPEELLADMRRVAEELRTSSISETLYCSHGKFNSATLVRAFGSWPKALAAAGLQPTGWKPKATDEELFANMAAVWEHVGRQPKQKDFRPPVSRFSETIYCRRYGSWRKALEAFVANANSEIETGERNEDVKLPTEVTLPQQGIHKTSRSAGWKLRHLVMQRDHFACRYCGASPAKNPAVDLDLDHIKPWSEGGESVMGNLQTLCKMCNIGKGNLSQE